MKGKMTMKKLKWFKRVISGALAVAVCATSLFSGVDFGVFEASALDTTKYTNLQEFITGAVYGQSLVPQPYNYETSKLYHTTEVFCIQKGAELGRGEGHFVEQTPNVVTDKWRQKAIAEICYLGQASVGTGNFNHMKFMNLSGYKDQLAIDRYVAIQCLIWETVGKEYAYNRNGALYVTKTGGRNSDFTMPKGSSINYYSVAHNYTARAGAIYDWVASTMINRRKNNAVAADSRTGKVYNMTRSGSNYTVTIDLSELRQNISAGTYGRAFTEQIDIIDTIKAASGWNCTISGTKATITASQSVLAPNATKSFTYTRDSGSGFEYHEYHNTVNYCQNKQKLAWGNKLDPIDTTIKFKAPPEEKGGFTFRKQWKNIDSTDKTLINSVVADAEFVLRKGTTSYTYYKFTKQAEGNYVYNGTTTTDIASATKMKTVLTDGGGEGIIWMDGLPAGQYTVVELPKYNKIHSCRSSEGNSIYHTYFRAGSVNVNIVAGKKPVQDQMKSPLMNWYSFQHADLEVYKQDDKYNGIQGAKFGLYVDYTELRNNNGNGTPQKYNYVIESDGNILTRNGVQWKVGTQVQTATSDIHGKVDFGAVPAYAYIGENVYRFRYIVKEIEAPKGYALSADGINGHSIKMDAKAHSVQGQYTGETYFTNSPQRMEITINKVDDKGKKLQGAVFGLYSNQDGLELRDITKTHHTIGDIKVYHKGDLIAYGTTNSNGKLVFGDERGQVLCRKLNEQTGVMRNLLEGKYYVQEITPPKNYVANKQKYEFTFTPNNKTEKKVFEYEATVPNKHKNGEITVIKEGDSGEKLQGAEFILYPTNKNVVIDGKTYKAGDTSNPISRGKTGTNGKLVFSKRVPTGYNYTVQEIKAPKGYVLSANSKKTFDLDDNNSQATFIPVTVPTFKNTPQKLSIQAIKKGTDGVKVIPLTGVTFELRAAQDIKKPNGDILYAKNALIDTQVTKAVGGTASVNFKNVPAYDKNGNKYKYNIIETAVPAGYILDKTPIEITVPDNAPQTQEIISVAKTVTNDWDTVRVNVKKVDETTSKPLAGAKYALYANETINYVDGSPRWEKDQEISVTPETDATGNTTFKDEKGNVLKIPVNHKYYIKEVKAPTNFIRNVNWRKEFTAQGNGNGTVAALAIEQRNKPKPLSVTVEKIDKEERTPLEDAEFTLYAPADKDVVNSAGEVLYKKGQRIQIITTTFNGKKATAEFKNVPLGYTYKVVETKAPDNYTNFINEKLERPTWYVEAKDDGKDTEEIKVVIKAENEWQKGIITVRKTDENGDPLAGAVFGLYSVDANGKKGKKIEEKTTKIVKNATTGENEAIAEFSKQKVGQTFIIREEKAPYGYVNLGDKTERKITLGYKAQLYYSSVSTSYTNDWQRGDISVYKYSTKNGTKIPLEGAEFVLYALENVKIGNKTVYTAATHSIDPKTNKVTFTGKIIQRLSTNDKGYLKFDEVPTGYNYMIVETKAPDGYINAHPTQKIELKYNENIEFVEKTASEINKETSLYISKQTLTGSKPLAGATLQLIRVSDNKVIREWKSKADKGEYFEKLLYGKYILREIASPAGFVISTDIPFTINDLGKAIPDDENIKVSYEGETPVIVMFDETTKVSVSKVDITSGEELIGAKLEVRDDKGNLIESWTSNGKAHLIEGKLIVGHTYTLTETASPAGYVIANKITFTVKGRDKTTGKYVVQKVTMKDDYTHTDISKKDITTGKEIVGATLEIRDSEGRLVERWITDGKPHRIEKLKAGKYTLTETAHPDGYLIADTVTFEVTGERDANGKAVIKLVVMHDDYTKLSIQKIDKTTKQPLVGARLQLLDKDGNLVYVPDGKGGTIPCEWVSDGTPHMFYRIPAGTYILHEVEAPKGYVRFADKTIVITDEDFMVNGKVDNKIVKTITAEDDYTKTEIDKTSITDGKKVIGAHLVIKDSKGNKVTEWDTNDKVHRIDRLPVGDYTLTETFAPNGYVIANTIKFTVKETGEIQKVHMIDDITKLEINKYRANAKTNEDKPLAGAVLKLTDKETGEIVDQWTTDGTTHKIYEKLTAGKTYVLEELSAPAGYVVCKDKKEITISTNGKVDTLSLTNDTTKVDILKSTITGDEELEGAHLQVIDTTTNKVVEEWVSEKESHYIEAKLVAGRKYILRETISPNGFTIANDITFVVSTEGKVDKIIMKDEVTKLAISKVSAVTGKELAGATMQVIDKETGHTVDEWVTGEETDGKTSKGDMTHRLYRKLVVNRTYILREKIAPENYILADDIEFTVNADGTVTTETEGVLSKDDTMDKITMTDYQQTGDVVVLKQTEGNKNIANIGFILSGKSNLGVDIYERVLTDENGKATFSNIPVGTYFINEDEDTVPYAYLVAEPQQVEVFYRQTSVNTFNNQERTGSIKIQKKTEGMLNIKGITLILKGISDSGREIEMTSETDENGEALFENLPIGTYAVTEVGETVPEGYLVADELTVTCVYAQTTTKELFNEEKSGSIEIHKTTEGMLNIKDIKFHLTGVSDAGRAINLEAITDEKGIAKFDKVPVGTYMITEDGKTTPIAYMVADKKECKVSYSETTTVEIKNEEKTGSIKVQKKTEGMKDISGIKFHLTGTSDSGRAINLEAVTDKNGVADFGQVPIGTYVISEDGATVPTAYLVADNQECKAIYAQETTVTFVNEKKPTEEQPPQTGYNHPIGIFLPTMLISLAGIAVFSRKRKEEE